jgi:hypothetical protein
MERIRQGGLEIFDKVASLGYNIEIKSRQNLRIIRENPSDPCVFYYNHATMDDPFLLVDLLQKEAPNRLKNVVIPVSEYYTQFKNHPSYALAVRLGRMEGFVMPEVVQSYRTRGLEENTELVGKVNNLNIQFTRILKEKLTDGYCVMIAPEGHRSEERSLLPAESGVGLMVTIMNNLRKEGKIENGYFIPVAIVFENPKGQSLHYNPREKALVKITVGEAIDPESIINEGKLLTGESKLSKVSSHILMHHLAEFLPVNMQGVYSASLFKETLHGRFEQKTDERGKVYLYDKEIHTSYEGKEI